MSIFISFFYKNCFDLKSVQVQESDEARQKFSNAKSISSAQFFGDQNKAAETEAQATLQKYSVCMVYSVVHSKAISIFTSVKL